MNQIINKKDYWNLSNRNFIALTFVYTIATIIFFVSNISKAAGVSMLAIALLHAFVSKMYSNKNKWAYIITYILYGAALLLNIFGPIFGYGKINIIGVLITIYILYYARKAQTQVN